MLIFNGWRTLLAIPLLALVVMVVFAISKGAGISLLVGGIAVAAMGFWINSATTREDPATGERQVIKHRFGFFFIPLQYWGILIVALGIFLMVQGQ